MIIIGIDPGSRATGYGLIQYCNKKTHHLDHGVIHSKDTNFMKRLHHIHLELKHIIACHQPNQLAIEQVFVHINPQAAIKLGQARGAALTAAADSDLSYHEYSPRTIKQSVTGYGAAQKSQIQQMIKLLLKLPSPPPADAADALAIALCHCHHLQLTHTLARSNQSGERT